MKIDELNIEQVGEALTKVEGYYRQFNGDIDLMKMSNDKDIYATWKQLRDRIRIHAKATKEAAAKCAS
jgi:hypothetical protein